MCCTFRNSTIPRSMFWSDMTRLLASNSRLVHLGCLCFVSLSSRRKTAADATPFFSFCARISSTPHLGARVPKTRPEKSERGVLQNDGKVKPSAHAAYTHRTREKLVSSE